jgi:hypothetical protein
MENVLAVTNKQAVTPCEDGMDDGDAADGLIELKLDPSEKWYYMNRNVFTSDYVLFRPPISYMCV